MWDYTASGTPSNYSRSRGQYAVLGLWAAEQMGVDVPVDTWKTIDDAWQKDQEDDGAWNYKGTLKEYPATLGMTAAGVATLFITQEMLHGDGIPATLQKQDPARKSIDKGIAWLAANAASFASDERSARAYPFATLYTFERAALASGSKYVGTIDWYDKGAAFLVKSQRDDGSWSTASGGEVTGRFGGLVDACFGLLFLARGLEPIAINKLQFGPPDPGAPDKTPSEQIWNEHPRDAANISRWIGKEIERPLAWQYVPIAGPQDDLQGAPLLLITSNQPINFTDGEMTKLRTYVEQGGMIVALPATARTASPTRFASSERSYFPAMNSAISRKIIRSTRRNNSARRNGRASRPSSG